MYLFYATPYFYGRHHSIRYSVYFVQTVAYQILWDVQFLFRNLSLAGALALVVAESKKEARTLFAGVPSLGENKPKTYLMLGGRILLVFMFITLIRLEFSIMQVSYLLLFSLVNICPAYFLIFICFAIHVILNILDLCSFIESKRNLLNFIIMF